MAAAAGVNGRAKPSLLIVEDNAVNTLVLKAILGESSYDLLEATDGYQAVEVALADRPEVILMDIMMPGKDGIRAAREILDQLRDDPPKILAVTGNALDSVRRECLEAGFSGVLVKPIDAGELRATVTLLLSGSSERCISERPNE